MGKGKDCEGSNAIIAAVDKPDPRPIYIGAWGGPREVAQAIWKVKATRSEKELKASSESSASSWIACQDASHEWLMDEFPDLFIIDSRKTYQGMFRSDSCGVDENIINNHGPSAPSTLRKGHCRPGVIEGDSPAFPVPCQRESRDQRSRRSHPTQLGRAIRAQGIDEALR